MNDERDVYGAVAGARPVGFVAVALNSFHERMGVLEERWPRRPSLALVP
jgi:hypothetical protein